VVYQYSCFDSDYSGMGTTLVGAAVLKDRAYIVNVGDSRAYQITKKRIIQVTRDQSLVEDMVRRGEITREEARFTPRRTSSPTPWGLRIAIKSDIFEVKLQKGDRLLFCSDGVSNLIDDEPAAGGVPGKARSPKASAATLSSLRLTLIRRTM
jgi:protein phosphatase